MSSKKPVVKYLKLGLAGLISLLVSLYSLTMVYELRGWRSWVTEELRILDMEQQELEKKAKASNEISSGSQSEDSLGAEDIRHRIENLQEEKKRLQDEMVSRSLSMIIYQVTFIAASIFFFLFGFLRLRTFKVWVWSHPMKLDYPSKAYQEVEITASLCFDYAVNRCLRAIRRPGH